MELTDKEILDYKIDDAGNTVRDMGSISYLGWISKKLNGVPTYTAATQELVMAISQPVFGIMAEGEKIRLFRKLLTITTI